MSDPFAFLGIPFDSDVVAVKAAFRAKAKLCHPDVRPDKDQAEIEFKSLCQIYEIALELAKRPVADRKPVRREFVDPGFGTVTPQQESWAARHGPYAPKPHEQKIYRILSEKNYDPVSKWWGGVLSVPATFAETGGVMFCMLAGEEFMVRFPPWLGGMWMDAKVTLHSGVRVSLRVGLEAAGQPLPDLLWNPPARPLAR